MKVKVINKSNYALPEYKHLGDAGMDLKANIENKLKIPAESRALIPTGLYVEIPEGYEIQIRPRSGLALNYGITVLNTPGTIDSNYRGEIGVILFNTSHNEITVEPGDRIAQAVLKKVEIIEWEEITQLSDSTRKQDGYGSTGI